MKKIVLLAIVSLLGGGSLCLATPSDYGELAVSGDAGLGSFALSAPRGQSSGRGLLGQLFGGGGNRKSAQAKAPQKRGLLNALFESRAPERTEIASIGSQSATPPAYASQPAPRPVPVQSAPIVRQAPTPTPNVQNPPVAPQQSGGSLVRDLLSGIESIGTTDSPTRATPEPEETEGRFANMFNQGRERREHEQVQRTERRALLSRLTDAFSQQRDADLRFVRTTAYTHTESDHKQWGLSSASGTRLTANRRYNSAAADWSVYPPGTKFKIVGEPTVYVVDDYGRALVGTKTIDIYRPSHASMNNWGVRNVQIQIVEEGCYHTACQILGTRLHHEHCKEMYRGARFKSWTT